MLSYICLKCHCNTIVQCTQGGSQVVSSHQVPDLVCCLILLIFAKCQSYAPLFIYLNLIIFNEESQFYWVSIDKYQHFRRTCCLLLQRRRVILDPSSHVFCPQGGCSRFLQNNTPHKLILFATLRTAGLISYVCSIKSFICFLNSLLACHISIHNTHHHANQNSSLLASFL